MMVQQLCEFKLGYFDEASPEARTEGHYSRRMGRHNGCHTNSLFVLQGQQSSQPSHQPGENTYEACGRNVSARGW